MTGAIASWAVAASLLGGCGSDESASEGAHAGGGGGSTATPSMPYEEFMVAMRDDVHLRTGVYLPQGEIDVPRGAILIRTRYWGFNDKQQAFHDGVGAFFTDRGYAVVVQSVRGFYGSEGTNLQYRGELEDGRDTTDWIVSQPWSNGRIATYGGSYLAYTALTAAADNPSVKVVILDDSPIDGNYDRRFSGIPSLLNLSWLNRLGKTAAMVTSDQLFVAQQLLHVEQADEVVLGASNPEWQDSVAHASPEDPFWLPYSAVAAVDDVCVPVLSIKSNHTWSDPDIIWKLLQNNACGDHENQRLLVTQQPHTFHSSAIYLQETQGMTENQLIVDYIDRFLGEKDIDLSQVPLVQYRAPTEPVSQYRAATDWPPPVAGWSLYLSGQGVGVAGTLQESQPGAELPTALYMDPENSACAEFPYAVYMTAPLANPVYVAGFSGLELYANATTVDADFTVTLHEVPANVSNFQLFNPSSTLLSDTLVAHGGLRARYRAGLDQEVPLVPGQQERFVLTMDAMVREFQAGNRILITVGGTRCHAVDPLLQFENPHTGEPLANQTHWLPSEYGVFHEQQAPSRLTLPVLQ